jgi:L-threonylcarbamoyladenylate synthase
VNPKGVIHAGETTSRLLLTKVSGDAAWAAAALRAGGMVAYPTETFYALGALLGCAPALARLAQAKLRPAGKPIPLIAADLEMLGAAVARFEPLALRLAERFWPGPLTLVLPASMGLPAEVAAGGTVGVRVPGSPLARQLCRLAGGPITSTSANLSGTPPVTRPADLAAEILANVDAVLDGGETPGGLPSTVVAVEAEVPRLLRAGAVPWAAVLAACR